MSGGSIKTPSLFDKLASLFPNTTLIETLQTLLLRKNLSFRSNFVELCMALPLL